jgi:hypothetical protein
LFSAIVFSSCAFAVASFFLPSDFRASRPRHTLPAYPDEYEPLMAAATFIGFALSFTLCVASLWANKTAKYH